MDEQREWMSASEAVGFLEKSMHPIEARRALCTRAHAGLVRARAFRFFRDGIASDNTNVPSEFWWAHGAAALTQNWKTGDFETWIKQKIHLQAFGVDFSRADIERMLPQRAIEHDPHSDKNFSGNNTFLAEDASLDPTRRKPTAEEEREADRRSAEQARARAARDFAEPFWPLGYAWRWVAFQRPERMRESLSGAILYGGREPLAVTDFKAALLRALQEGRLHGVRDGRQLPPEFWAGVQPYTFPSNVYLRRNEMLALWPALATPSTSEEEAREVISA